MSNYNYSMACWFIKRLLFNNAMDIATDQILTSVEFLALSETELDDHSSVEIAGYSSINQFKRPGVRAVAIYQKDTAFNVAVPHTIQNISEEYDAMLGVADQVGHICAALIMGMDIEVLVITVYISPGTTVQDTNMFMTRNLFNYVKRNAPIVVTADFKVKMNRSQTSNFEEHKSGEPNTS